MQITPLDWAVVALYFLFNLAVGLYYRSRARSSVDEFFLSGRDVPWWLAGTSMVATTFAADTPLAVTGMVAVGGIAGNWLWWCFVASGMLTVFFYARLWRRSGVMTDIEFAEIRYAGKPAAFLRGFRALYLGIPINCIILGWVNKAMVDILMLVLGVTQTQALALVFGIMAITCFISALSGLWGVLVTDLFQFVIKMGMVIVLAVFAVRAVGGIDAMKQKLALLDAGRHGSVLSFVPDLNSAWMPLIAFLVYISLNWWATWYPGAEPGGGGYIAQRMLSARDEKHSLLATLWFNVAHYAVRPWPWILVALVSLILFPGLAKPETGYIRVMLQVLPASLRGLMIAAFAAAYMSTIATQLNWGASYLVNDFYRRFWKPEADQRHYVLVSRIATVLLMLISIVVTANLDSIAGAWKLLLVTGAGTGGVLLLRWYWWRINAWSEVSAMLSAFVVSVTLQLGWHWDTDKPVDFAWLMIITVTITTLVWLTVTFLTSPEPEGTLVSFYRRTRPSGSGWAPIARLAPEVKTAGDGLSNLLDWIGGCMLIYGVLFGTGKLLLHEVGSGLVLLAIGAVGMVIIYRDLSRRGWVRWWIRVGVLGAAALLAGAAGPTDFGMVEFDAAVADYNQNHKVKINKPKIVAELNVEPPETFRVEPYTAGGAHITGGDLRGLMYALLEASDQIRATGRLKRAHGVPNLPLRGVRVHAEPQASWFASAEFWRTYFAQLARDRFNRMQIVFDIPPERSGLATLGMISQAAAQYGVDAVVGLKMATPAAVERILVECPAVRSVAIRSSADPDARALFQVPKEVGRRVVIEVSADSPLKEAFLQAAGQSGTPVRLFSPFGVAPNPRPDDFYLTLEADQLESNPDKVGALLTNLGSGLEIASPLDAMGRPDTRRIAVWGRQAYGPVK